MPPVTLLSYNKIFNTQYKAYNKINSDSNKFDYPSQEISFKGRGRNSFLIGAYLTATALTSIMATTFTLSVISSSRSNIEEHINETQISKNIGWDKNIRVLAANGQNHELDTLYYASKPNDQIISSYSKCLINNLKLKGVNTIEEAHSNLARGYIVGDKKYFTLDTPRNKLNIFNKLETGKERFLLIISQANDKYSPMFERLGKDFKDEIKGIYNIPDEDIINISVRNELDFKDGINKIKNKLERIYNKSNAELLIVYFGHGVAESKRYGAVKSEGEMEGYILGNLQEESVKQIFNENFKNIKTLFILQTCHSGAWIADNSKNALKKLNQLV